MVRARWLIARERDAINGGDIREGGIVRGRSRPMRHKSLIASLARRTSVPRRVHVAIVRGAGSWGHKASLGWPVGDLSALLCGACRLPIGALCLGSFNYRRP